MSMEWPELLSLEQALSWQLFNKYQQIQNDSFIISPTTEVFLVGHELKLNVICLELEAWSYPHSREIYLDQFVKTPTTGLKVKSKQLRKVGKRQVSEVLCWWRNCTYPSLPAMQYFALSSIQLACVLPNIWQLKNGQIQKTCRRALWKNLVGLYMMPEWQLLCLQCQFLPKCPWLVVLLVSLMVTWHFVSGWLCCTRQHYQLERTFIWRTELGGMGFNRLTCQLVSELPHLWGPPCLIT